MDSDLESKLISLMSQLLLGVARMKSDSDLEPKMVSLFIQIISVVRCMDLDSQPKPESKLMSLVTQTVSLFNSTDLESLPNPLSKLISLISKKVCMDEKPESDLKFKSLLDETYDLKPYPELISLIFLIFSVVISTNTELKELTSVFDQVEGYFDEENFLLTHDGSWDLEPKLISLISELLLLDDSTDPQWEPKITSLIIGMIRLFKSRDVDSQPKPQSKLMSLVSQTVSLFNSTDLDSLPKPLAKLITYFSQKVSIDSDQKQKSDLKLKLLVEETLELKPDPELVSLIRKIVSVVVVDSSKKCQTLEPILLVPQEEVSFYEGKFRVRPLWLHKNSDPWRCFIRNGRFISLTRDNYFTHFLCGSCKGEYHNEYEKVPVNIRHPLHKEHPLQLVLNQGVRNRECYCCDEALMEAFYYCSFCDYFMNIACAEKPPRQYGSETLHRKSKLIPLIYQLMALEDTVDPKWKSKFMSLIIQIIFLVRAMDLGNSQLKPESKLMLLVTLTASLCNSMDLDSLPKPLTKLISFISQKVSVDSDEKPESDSKSMLLLDETLKFKPDPENKEVVSIDDLDQRSYLLSLIKYHHEQSDSYFQSLVDEILELKPEPELISLIRQTVSLFISKKLILLVPQVEVSFHEGKFRVQRHPWIGSTWIGHNWRCLIGDWDLVSLTRDEYITHFCCRSCNGENHKEYEKVPVEIKHPLHRKHSLQLAFNSGFKWILRGGTRECYCCNENLMKVFYFCSACDFAMNIACADKAPDLYIPLSKWHGHPLALFPIKTPLTCDICALAHSNSPFYICHPCAFVAHLRCINLPRVIRISRHLHRICHTPSFEEGDWSCGVCRRKIDNDYGGYSCIKDGCSYAAHARCATQSNVWDDIDLDGEPEEIEEEVPQPFVTISDGIIQHFSHDQHHHHLRLDENTCRDYDENKLCQACVTPIYFGNFYSCVQCEFILHESCAHLSRKTYHPTHPHLLTLAIMRDAMDLVECAACRRSLSTTGFYYECDKEKCVFRLHVQCATISEPLVHTSHVHPLFLTSKPGEKRKCSVCPRGIIQWIETFNCIDDDFALCFRCATLPQTLRYTHDKHILTLSYREETDTATYWCEACEGKINREEEEGFYMCDEYCCVTLHIECLIGRELYMKPDSSYFYAFKPEDVRQVSVLANNHHKCRPICTKCEKRCPHKIVFQCSGSVFCSDYCLDYLVYGKSS